MRAAAPRLTDPSYAALHNLSKNILQCTNSRSRRRSLPHGFPPRPALLRGTLFGRHGAVWPQFRRKAAGGIVDPYAGDPNLVGIGERRQQSFGCWKRARKGVKVERGAEFGYGERCEDWRFVGVVMDAHFDDGAERQSAAMFNDARHEFIFLHSGCECSRANRTSFGRRRASVLP